MNLETARLLCNLPDEWEGLEFTFVWFDEHIYVAAQTLPPVAIDKSGNVKTLTFEVESESLGK